MQHNITIYALCLLFFAKTNGENFSLKKDWRIFIGFGTSSRINEVNANTEQTSLSLGVSKNIFQHKKIIFWPSLAYNNAITLFGGSDDVYVRPMLNTLATSFSAGYKIAGHKTAIIPYIGLKNNLGFVTVEKKLFDVVNNHYFFFNNTGPTLGMLFKMYNFGFALEYAIGFGRLNYRQELDALFSYTFF